MPLANVKEAAMTNPDHLNTLRQGVDAWNAWREKEPSITPDLNEAKLRDAYLSVADLHWANLGGAPTRGGRSRSGRGA
jgi:hypothetical protein